MTTIFEKEYDGESLYDLGRDIHEAFNPAFNPAIDSVPQDVYGFQKGTFKVKVEWVPEGGVE